MIFMEKLTLLIGGHVFFKDQNYSSNLCQGSPRGHSYNLFSNQPNSF